MTIPAKTCCRRMQANFTIGIKPYHHVYQFDHNTNHKPIRCNERNHCWKLFFFQRLQHPTLANALLCNWEADYVFPCPRQPVHITEILLIRWFQILKLLKQFLTCIRDETQDPNKISQPLQGRSYGSMWNDPINTYIFK